MIRFIYLALRSGGGGGGEEVRERKRHAFADANLLTYISLN